MFFPRRGAVYKLKPGDHNPGSAINGKYAVILQNNVGNQYSSIVIVSPVCPGEGRIAEIDVSVTIPGEEADEKAVVKLNHIYSINKAMLDDEVCQICHEEMYQIDMALELSLGLVSI